ASSSALSARISVSTMGTLKLSERITTDEGAAEMDRLYRVRAVARRRGSSLFDVGDANDRSHAPARHQASFTPRSTRKVFTNSIRSTAGFAKPIFAGASGSYQRCPSSATTDAGATFETSSGRKVRS